MIDIVLIANILLMYAILIGVNIPATRLGIDFDDNEPRHRLWFEPPGYVISIVWFVLFTLLGIARYTVTQPPGWDMQWLLIGLAVMCASYAYYTVGLAKLTGISALWFGLLGNGIVIVLALVVSYVLYPISPMASLLVAPVAVWTTFATAIVVGEMRVQKLI